MTARKQNRESLSMGLLREEHGIEESEEEEYFDDIYYKLEFTSSIGVLTPSERSA